jgi:hypothetical protein
MLLTNDVWSVSENGKRRGILRFPGSFYMKLTGCHDRLSSSLAKPGTSIYGDVSPTNPRMHVLYSTV